MNVPGYTLLHAELLRAVISPENQTNAFMLLTPHGEVIYNSPPVGNQPVLALCYSGVPLTVNYSNNDENVRVLGIVDDNLHSTLRDKSFDSSSTKSSSRDPSKATLAKLPESIAAVAARENPHHFRKIIELKPTDGKSVYEELQVLASAVKKGDTQHHDSKMMASTGATKVSDAHRSFLFSHSYPITKMVGDDGKTLIPLQNVVHPNKRYTLRVDDDGFPEVARGDFEYKMNLFLPIASRRKFEKHLEQLETTAGIIIVTKENCLKYDSIVQNVNGDFPDLILREQSHILASWNIMLLPVLPVASKSKSSKKGHEDTKYYMLPYRIYKLSGVKCVAFDLWHILCYNDSGSAYSTGGLSMTQTDIYMNLLTILGIKLVVGIDLTCNVVGVDSGAWPLLTYDQIMRNLAFQESMLQSIGAIGGRPLSSRISIELDLLPHFNHVVNELNGFLDNVTGSKTTAKILESIHSRGRIVPRREHRGFYSNDTETYLALHEYMKRLCGHEAITHDETFDREQHCIMVVSKKKQTEKKSKSAATATATAEPLTNEEVCHLYRLVVPHQHVTHTTIEQLRKYVKDNSIQFRLTEEATETFKQHFPSAEASVDKEYNLDPGVEIPSVVDNENKFIGFFNNVLRLWVIPELKSARHPESILCFYHKNIEPPNKYDHLQRRVVNAENIVSEIRNAELDESFGDKYTIVGLLSSREASRDFKPYSKFEEWWRQYKVDHKLMKLGGGNTTKMSNTRKRKPHKRAVTKRYRRFKHKSLKNKSLKK